MVLEISVINDYGKMITLGEIDKTQQLEPTVIRLLSIVKFEVLVVLCSIVVFPGTSDSEVTQTISDKFFK